VRSLVQIQSSRPFEIHAKNFVITGVHLLFYSKEPEQDRVFFRDVLGLRAVDIGHGWLIFAMPPSEAAVHPSSATFVHDEAGHSLASAVPYLMCDDLKDTMKSLVEKNVRFAPIAQERWGQRTSFLLPSGSEMGLYQPLHPTALNLK
jgi:hypothetical protein